MASAKVAPFWIRSYRSKTISRMAKGFSILSPTKSKARKTGIPARSMVAI